MTGHCECSDTGCKAHPGKHCANHGEVSLLYRVDMEDHTGTAFCEACADDAFESGLFTTESGEVLTEDE